MHVARRLWSTRWLRTNCRRSLSAVSSHVEFHLLTLNYGQVVQQNEETLYCLIGDKHGFLHSYRTDTPLITTRRMFLGSEVRWVYRVPLSHVDFFFFERCLPCVPRRIIGCMHTLLKVIAFILNNSPSGIPFGNRMEIAVQSTSNEEYVHYMEISMAVLITISVFGPSCASQTRAVMISAVPTY